jgi:hypothetical protein
MARPKAGRKALAAAPSVMLDDGNTKLVRLPLYSPPAKGRILGVQIRRDIVRKKGAGLAHCPVFQIRLRHHQVYPTPPTLCAQLNAGF